MTQNKEAHDASWRDTVRRHTCVLLDPDAYPGAQLEAASGLFDLLSGSIGLDDREVWSEDDAESTVAAGIAISPRDAARCTRDFARTSKFLRGTRAAINAARREFPGETIRVLYAGCGPFALLALPIAHEWSPEEVSFALLDYHARSLDAARDIACRLRVQDRISALVQVDASRYLCEPSARPHVLVTETMRRALETEPQVAITRHLTPQLMPGGFLVPECIELHATLIDLSREVSSVIEPVERERIELGRVMVVDKDGDRCADTTWPDHVPDRMVLAIRTYIRTWGSICLRDYESGLTGPAPWPLNHRPAPGQRLRFEYRLEPSPGLICSLEVV